jgi:hypothetical protein
LAKVNVNKRITIKKPAKLSEEIQVYTEALDQSPPQQSSAIEMRSSQLSQSSKKKNSFLEDYEATRQKVYRED